VHIHDGGHNGDTEPGPDDRPWLRALWQRAEAARAVVELRYLHDPASACLDAFLLVRTERADRHAALDAAWRLRDDLMSGLPARVLAEPVGSDAELSGICTPFSPDPGGLVEIRKPLRVDRTTRADLGNPWLAAVLPWQWDNRSRVPLWRDLAGLPFRLLLSVGLIPYRIGPALRRLMADRATMMATLASPGPSLTHTVYGRPQPADQFAAQVYPVLTDAIGRYTDIAFQVRVSLAADRPLPAHLAERVADAISPRGPGVGAVAVRPDPREGEIAWRNVTALNFDPLPTAHLQGCPPDAIGELERTLGAIADIDEAAAAFRLPYEETARPPVFRPLAARDPAR
jgi:hypothetical protein